MIKHRARKSATLNLLMTSDLKPPTIGVFPFSRIIDLFNQRLRVSVWGGAQTGQCVHYLVLCFDVLETQDSLAGMYHGDQPS